MLQKLNERFKGIITWSIITLIATTFALLGLEYYNQSHQLSAVEVEVNGYPIFKQKFEFNYRLARQQYDSAKLTQENDQLLRKKVLQNLIDNQVILQAAQQNGFEVSNNQVQAAIINAPQFMKDGQFSYERYIQALNNAMLTPGVFQEEVKQGMLVNQQRFALIGTNFALPEEIKRFVKLDLQQRDYEYLEIPVTKFMQGIQVSEKTIQDYYNSHPKKFTSPEMVAIHYVQLSMAELKNNINLSKEEVSQYYKDNKSNFLIPAKWQVAHLLFATSKDDDSDAKKKAEKAYQIITSQPEKFDELVQSESDDKISRFKKGILPWLIASQTKFDKDLVNLKVPGQITHPIKTDKGYEIFKLIKYEPPSVQPFEDLEDKIREQMLLDAAERQYAIALEKLNDLSYHYPDSLDAVAKALSLQIKKSTFFSQMGGNDTLTKNQQVINAAFSEDVLEHGNNSETIQVDNDSVLVLRVAEKKPAMLRPFDTVKNEIRQILSLKQAKKLTAKYGVEVANASLSSNENIKGLEWHQVKNAKRESEQSNNINNVAFNIPKAGQTKSFSLANGSYMIVRLINIKDGSLEQLDKEKKSSLSEQMEVSYGNLEYELYVNHLISKAKIKTSK